MKPNSNSLRTRFATRFLRSLAKINTSSITGSPTPGDILRRRLRIKLAADHSIARAVRSPRAWKRAVLSSSTTCRSALHLAKQFHNIHHQKKSSRSSCRIMNGGAGDSEVEAAAELEKLVPGGQGMKSLESLLEETSHYVKCLRTQVEVMTSILHFCNSTPN